MERIKRWKLIIPAVLSVLCIICAASAFFPRPKVPALPATPPASLWDGAPYNGNYTLEALPPSALADEPIRLRVSGLQPGQMVTLRARMGVSPDRGYESFATFEVADDGKVDTATAAPRYGSYTGVDAMGLFWSMVPVRLPESQEKQVTRGIDQALVIHLTAEASAPAGAVDQVLASLDLTRRFASQQVTYRPLDEQGMRGSLFYPNDNQPHPVVICLGGSEGGLSEGMAALLASHGYTALALAYFGFDPLPGALVEVPLEYFARAITWLKTQPSADATRLAVLGGSKGAELALLLGATYPQDIRAVVAYKPSSVVWMGLYSDPSQYSQGPKSSWSLNGQGVPFLNGALTWDMVGFVTGREVALRGSYAGGLKDTPAAASAAIPVEKINGPVLLISGGDDQTWPSADMAEQIMARLKANQHPFDDRSLVYPQAGHGIWLPYLPVQTSEGNTLFGGTPAANAQASAESWPVVLEFLSSIKPAQ